MSSLASWNQLSGQKTETIMSISELQSTSEQRNRARHKANGGISLRRLGMVMAICIGMVLSVNALAEAKPPPNNIETIQKGCVSAGVRSNQLRRVARDFFRRKIGVQINSEVIGMPSLCGNFYFVPVWATPTLTGAPNLWYVKISRSSSRCIRLLRPA